MTRVHERPRGTSRGGAASFFETLKRFAPAPRRFCERVEPRRGPQRAPTSGSMYTARLVTASRRFYSDLPAVHHFADVLDDRSYVSLPGDWDVVISDVRGSTAAIEAGRYQDVNAIGAGTIIAIRNALSDVEVPFVFGGDGATVLTPNEHRETVRGTLRGLQQLARSVFDLDLRCGLVPAQTLLDAGHTLRVAKFHASPRVSLAMLMGSALSVAESWVKHPTTEHDANLTDGERLPPDLTGFECRWQPVKSRHGVTLALLVLAFGDSTERQATYRELFTILESLTGSATPAAVHSDELRLKGPLSDFGVEAKLSSGARTGREYQRRLSRARQRVVMGRALLATGTSMGGFNGRTYKSEVLQNCDFKKFDGVLRMVIDVSHTTHQVLRQTLERYRHDGRLCYGTHASEAALITCHVRSYSGDHLHFVDGSNGGYALAAKELKAQLASRARR